MLPQTRELWLDNLRSTNPLILAGTGVIGGTTNFDPRLMNYDMALTELTNTVIGLQSSRRVVMIGCRAVPESDEELDRMMTHLAKVKVPGIVAALSAEHLQRAFVEVGDAANMFFMSPLDSDPTLASLVDRGLVWHMGPGADVIARTYAPLLKRTLAHLNLTSDIRVATVVTSDDRFLVNVQGTIESTPQRAGLFFNGQSIADNRNNDHYLAVSILSGDANSVAAQVQQLLAFRPHVIISAAGTEFLSRVIPAVESGWSEASGGQTLPFYLLSPDNYNDDALAGLLGSNSSVRGRMAGVNWAAAEDSATYDDYIGRWETAFPEERDVRGLENYYDAAYYLIYAAAGAGQLLTNGTHLVDGMARLLSGTRYNVGPSDMPRAMQALNQSAANIALYGTLGAPNFSSLDGTRQAPGSVWCVDSTNVTRSDVLRYVPGSAEDASTASLQGTFPCFEFSAP